MKRLKILLLIGLELATPKFLETNYHMTTQVVSVIRPCDEVPYGLVICEAENGRLYFIDGSDDWIEGDIAELTISDNGTTYRTDDDKVIKALYTGNIY